jgi:hypothetical protein
MIPNPGLDRFRAKRPAMPLGHRHQMPRVSVLVIIAFTLLGPDGRVESVRNRSVSAVGPVLVEQRCAFVVVPHPGHQVPERDAHADGERVTRVASRGSAGTGHLSAWTTYLQRVTFLKPLRRSRPPYLHRFRAKAGPLLDPLADYAAGAARTSATRELSDANLNGADLNGVQVRVRTRSARAITDSTTRF